MTAAGSVEIPWKRCWRLIPDPELGNITALEDRAMPAAPSTDRKMKSSALFQPGGGQREREKKKECEILQVLSKTSMHLRSECNWIVGKNPVYWAAQEGERPP